MQLLNYEIITIYKSTNYALFKDFIENIVIVFENLNK